MDRLLSSELLAPLSHTFYLSDIGGRAVILFSLFQSVSA